MAGMTSTSHGVNATTLADGTTLEASGGKIQIKDSGVTSAKIGAGEVKLVDVESGLIGITVLGSGNASIVGDDSVQEVGNFSITGDLGDEIIILDVQWEAGSTQVLRLGTTATGNQVVLTGNDDEGYISLRIMQSNETAGQIRILKILDGNALAEILDTNFDVSTAETFHITSDVPTASTGKFRWIAYKTNP